MNAGIVATRYAKAIYDFALDKKEESSVYDAFNLLINGFAQLPQLAVVLKNPTIPNTQKAEVLLTACEGTENETIRKVIQLILKNGRISDLANIALVYTNLYRKAKGIVIASLTSVTPVGESETKALVSEISKITDHQVEFHTCTDPDIIGGFILEIEDYRLDASVKDQLNRLRLDLVKN